MNQKRMKHNHSSNNCKQRLSKPGLIVASLIAANFLASMMQTMLNTALPRMMNDLGIRETQGQWLVTVYFLMIGIVVPVAGFMIGRFSTRALFFASGGAFVTGTLLAAAAPGFAPLLGGRLIQGIGAGLLMPLFQTTILRVFPKERIGSAMGLVGLVMGLAPAMGPALSGFVVEHHTWRLLFYGMLPIALLNLALAYVTLRNVGEKKDSKLDLLSVLYSSAGFSALLYGMSLASKAGEGMSFWLFLIAGTGFVSAFIVRQLRLAEPLLDVRLFRHKTFREASLMGVVLFFVFIGAELMLPLYAQNIRGLTPRESGLMLMPGALLMGISGLISGRLYDRFGAASITRIAFLIMTATMVTFAMMLSFQTPFLPLACLFGLFMVTVGFIMSPITAFAMSAIPSSMIRHASPMTITIRSFAGSASGAIMVATMTRVADGSPLPFPGDMLYGVQTVFWVLAAIAGTGVLLAYRIAKPSPAVTQLKEEVSV